MCCYVVVVQSKKKPVAPPEGEHRHDFGLAPGLCSSGRRSLWLAGFFFGFGLRLGGWGVICLWAGGWEDRQVGIFFRGGFVSPGGGYPVGWRCLVSLSPFSFFPLPSQHSGVTGGGGVIQAGPVHPNWFSFFPPKFPNIEYPPQGNCLTWETVDNAPYLLTCHHTLPPPR